MNKFKWEGVDYKKYDIKLFYGSLSFCFYLTIVVCVLSFIASFGDKDQERFFGLGLGLFHASLFLFVLKLDFKRYFMKVE